MLRKLLFFLSLQAFAAAAIATSGVYSPPASLHLSPFYKKYCDASGIPIVASLKVSDSALIAARNIILGMLSKRPDILAELKRQNIHIAVMSPTEVTTDIPEHSDLYRRFPNTDWNKRCRGIGATFQRRTCSCAEENLLQLPYDRYRGENILIHEFGHTILNIGIAPIHPDFLNRVQQAYANARNHELWNNTYAATNFDEYWAEGVQDWFDANLYASSPNGIHNQIHTQAQLWRYDPGLAQLLSEVFPANLKWDGRSRLIYR